MKVLTICGSMRFAEQMKEIADKLEYEDGYCVLQPAYCANVELTPSQIKMLTEAHYKKIDLSDGIYVVNIGGYIGESVSQEIAYAKNCGKEIIYHERNDCKETYRLNKMTYAKVQDIAKQTIEFLKRNIKVGMSLTELRKLAEGRMIVLGADSFWYWDVGAFVFAGEETTLSVSGKNYITSERQIAENDIITIDLSPQVDDIWGDYARTIIIENGKVVDTIGGIQNNEWREGLLTEDRLHSELKRFAAPDTTFEQLYFYMNGLIAELGYVNSDFMGNLGHSIEKQKQDRIYIEQGNLCMLGDARYFTFEPHISKTGSKYGYKMENIYYFENDKLKEL